SIPAPPPPTQVVAVVQPPASPPATSEVPAPAEAVPAPLVDAVERVLIPADAIQARLAELAAQIDQDYADLDDTLLLVGVLKGAFVIMADLARHLTIPNSVDF